MLTLIREQLKRKITENRISDKAQISKMVEMVGPVWIEEGVVIHPFSVIVGPTYIGRGTTIGNFTQIRESLVGQDTLVGERTSIVRSVLGDRCKFHINYLGDSLLAEDVDMGGRTSTANLRLDRSTVKSTISGIRVDTGLQRLGVITGKNTIFGGNCVLMPGVKIGTNCIVGPRSILYEDLADNMRCKVKQELQVEQLSQQP